MNGTMAADEIRSVLQAMVGHRCEGADNPYGSILRLDIGPLGLSPGDSPSARPHGWRHLTIESPWRLASDNDVLCDWNEEGGPHGSISNLITPLLGRTLIAVRADPPAWDLRLQFSGGFELFVFSDSDEDRDDAWFILGTDGLTLSAGPQRGSTGGAKLKSR